ncbi:hypothetical protein Fmac_025809 [Flemingia macrophylla]|uniref:H(+)-exporting diphosphatase n=1 Tax=Flemingia macrophylla TaxID=520843 RepID=A0ABD1LD37_9FABA
MLIYVFSAWACSAVGRTAHEVVNEVRRQFIERPGIMDYKEKPDYGRCVAIVASASLGEMIKPGALAIISPMVVGFLFRLLGYHTGHPLLGAEVVAAFLMFSTVSGILMALFLNTADGAWDNAKKYIETGALGGKGSEAHKAADIEGDHSKDKWINNGIKRQHHVNGFLFRVLGYHTGHPLLGAEVVAAFLMFATVSGILMALFLNTAGGAWDNAKKYIETGALGGKGSEAHKAAVTGDT